MTLHWQGAAKRYFIIVWFPRFERLEPTAMGSIAFLTFFLSMLSAAPFIYYARTDGYALLQSAWSWVLFAPLYLLTIVVLQNLFWLLIRGLLWVLEEM